MLPVAIDLLLDDETAAKLLALLEGDHRLLKSINKNVNKLLGIETQEAADISGLIARVTEAAGVDQSMKVLVEEIATELDVIPGAQALAEKLRTGTDELQKAVAANKPSE